jgi:hypothetical protein
MANRALRIAVAAATLVAFVVLWSSIAAKPWTATSAPAKPDVDPRLAALDRWERQLRSEAAVVKRTVDRRWAAYRKRLSAREAAIAAAKRRYAQQVAAARAAQARIAALQQAALASGTAPARQKTVTTYTVSRVASAPVVTQAAAAPVAAPTTKVVTLPPQVQVVTLPPASAPAPVTKSTSSKP